MKTPQTEGLIADAPTPDRARVIAKEADIAGSVAATTKLEQR